MICRNCGKEIDDRMIFCGYCGQRVQAQEKQEASGQTAQSSYDQAVQMNDGQAVQSNYEQAAQSRYGQAAQSNVSQAAQSRYGQAAQNKDGRAVQSNYGQPEQIGGLQAEQKRVCPNCGAEVDGNRHFCMKCGARVPKKQTDKTSSTLQQESETKSSEPPLPIKSHEPSGQPVSQVSLNEPLSIIPNAGLYNGKATIGKIYKAQGSLILYPDRLDFRIGSGNPIANAYGPLTGGLAYAVAKQTSEGEIPLSDIASAEVVDLGKNKAMVLTMKNGKKQSFVPLGVITSQKDKNNTQQNRIEEFLNMADIIRGVIGYE